MKLRRRPPLYEKPQDLLDYFYSYVDDCEQIGKMPNMAGFIAFCFGSYTTLYNYEAKEEFKSTFELIRLTLEDYTINDERKSDSIKKLIMQNKFGYFDKVQQETKVENIEVCLKRSST